MINTLLKYSNKYISILIVALIFSSFVVLFLGNTKLDQIDSLEELINNQEINCNQHYWTLKNKIDELGKYDVSVVHKDIYILPEINNISCLGKSVSVVLDSESVYIVSGINQKVFIYLCGAIFLFFMMLFQLSKDDKKLIVSLWIISLIFIQLYLFSSFKNPLISFINLLICVILVTTIIESFRHPKLKQMNLLIYLFCIVIFSIIFLKYIYFDYVVYLSFGAFIFLKSLQKLLHLNIHDIGYLILISHIGLILGGIDYPLSGNHLNYFPSILFDIDANYFSNHYLKDMIFPYPIFEVLIKFIINLFGFASLNFINYFSYFFGLLVVFIFIKSVASNNWRNICLIFTLVSGRLAIFSFFKDSGWDKRVYQNSFIKSGIGEASLMSHLFQPTTFDILILLVIVFLIKKNFVAANLTSFISIILHTYNILPIFLIYISYLVTDIKSLKEIVDKFKNSFLLILSLPVVFLINVKPLSSSREEFLGADYIMTNIRIPMHRMFSGNMSLFGRSNKEIVFDLFDNGSKQGFHFEIEYILITLVLFFLVKNQLIKNLNVLIFLMTVSTVLYTYIFQDSYMAIQIRNIVPWRASSIVYLFGLIYIINEFTKRFKGEKFSFFISSLILLVIFSLSVISDINDTKLRESFEDYGNLYDGQNLINPNDDFIIFGSSNNWNNNPFSFISTSHSYYGHPYKASEIIDWYKSIRNITYFFESKPNCEEFKYFILETGSKRAMFSSEEYIPLSVLNCENLIQENYLGFYIFENTK